MVGGFLLKLKLKTMAQGLCLSRLTTVIMWRAGWFSLTITA
jgi:hypothetical protein